MFDVDIAKNIIIVWVAFSGAVATFAIIKYIINENAEKTRKSLEYLNKNKKG